MLNNIFSIIIPCYNEYLRLEGNKFYEFAIKNPSYDLLFVNDGSKDDTLALLSDLALKLPLQISVLDLPKNVGKAEAIRQGVLFSSMQKRYKYLGFIDADLSAPLNEIEPLAQIISTKQLLIVAGARIKLVGKVIERSAVRHYFGRVFATYQDTLLQLGNYDTQCGLKIFESEFASHLFAEAFTSSWFFDIELFVRAKKFLGYEKYATQIAEIPLNEWKEIKGSKLKIVDFLKAPYEVLKIFRKYK